MARLSFDEIQEELDLEFLLDQESVPYKVTRGANGEQLNIKTCPNPTCGDDRWRVYFGTETGFGNCFLCGSTFTKASFIHNYYDHDGDWRQTYEQIESILKDQGWRPRRSARIIEDDNQSVQLPNSIPLPTPDGQNLQYLEDRGFDVELVRYFGLRYCEYGFWQHKTPDGEKQIQRFDNRVIIPVRDIGGELKTFQGRDLSGKSNRKYLFPSGLPGTGRYLFNAHNVMPTTHVAMGEGAFDVAAIKAAFDKDVTLRSVGAVGSFGKNLSYGSLEGDDQLGCFLKLRHAGLEIVTIIWDGEPAALTAALDAAKLLSNIGLSVRIALLRAGADPNEVPQDELRKAFYDAQTWSPSLDVRWRLRNPYSGK